MWSFSSLRTKQPEAASHLSGSRSSIPVLPAAGLGGLALSVHLLSGAGDDRGGGDSSCPDPSASEGWYHLGGPDPWAGNPQFLSSPAYPHRGLTHSLTP